MLNFAGVRRILIARDATDMRRGIDRLVSTISSELGGDPFSGDCFVFIARDRRRLKALVWEDGGFWLCLKRLEAGTFPLPRGWDRAAATVAVTPARIHALLEGIDVRSARFRKRHRHHPHARDDAAAPAVTR